jgi:hypothetical protein
MHPPASPEQYSIRYGRPNGVEMTQSPELKQFDQSARARLSGAQFDRVTGNSLVTTIDRVAQQTSKMTDTQLEHYVDTQTQLTGLIFHCERASRSR